MATSVPVAASNVRDLVVASPILTPLTAYFDVVNVGKSKASVSITVCVSARAPVHVVVFLNRLHHVVVVGVLVCILMTSVDTGVKSVSGHGRRRIRYAVCC